MMWSDPLTKRVRSVVSLLKRGAMDRIFVAGFTLQAHGDLIRIQKGRRVQWCRTSAEAADALRQFIKNEE